MTMRRRPAAPGAGAAGLMTRRTPVWAATFLGALLAALFLAFSPLAAAHADEVNVDKYDFVFAGNVRFDDTPLEGVEIIVSGHGYSEKVKTDEKGRWKVGVPEKGEYDITLVESTLPEGVVVSESENANLTISPEGATITAAFGLTDSKSVNFFLGEGQREVVSLTDQIVARTISGLNFGLMLALAAIGMSLIFGTIGLANFAHAESVTFGAVAALTLGVHLALPMPLAIPLAVILSGVLGLLLDMGLWRPLRRKGLSTVQLMILSVGLSLALRYTFQLFIGGSTQQLPPTNTTKITLVGPIALSPTDMVSMGLSIAVLLGVGYWLLYTRTGKATRGISDNPALAAASGINVDRVIRLIWVMGAALAGLSGVLWAYFRPGIKWDMGWQILLLIFAAIVLGGLGTAFGALVGSIIVGLLVELSTLWLPSDLKYVAPLVLLAVVLLFRPQGILGHKERIG
ncbi:MAG: branched-chain amino acid ABC transporter permease [Microbacterium sp.]